MRKTKVIAHCLVANEERFIWYALQSALPFVDKIMIWDTGSVDKTVPIIKSIDSEKIDFSQKETVDAQGHTLMRDQMLQQTDRQKYDWLLVLDGDEIWPEKSLHNLLVEAENQEPIAVVVRTINFIGDIYHASPASAGRYRFGNKVGHYNLRLINLKTPSLHVAGPHGQQVYYSGDQPLQQLPPEKLLILDDVFYYHATHLVRSSSDKETLKRSFKFKYEVGETIQKNRLPEIFFTKNRPHLVPDVSEKAPLSYWLPAFFLTIPRRLKRLLLPSGPGY